jgi:hypothetical protein
VGAKINFSPWTSLETVQRIGITFMLVHDILDVLIIFNMISIDS